VVDGHLLGDALGGPGVRRIQLPAGVLLDQGQGVRRVAVHLVGGAVDDRRLDAVLADVLQHVERAGGVHVEVGERIAHGPVVRGLGGRVDHDGDVTAVVPEDLPERVAVPDVDAVMGVRRAQLIGQPPHVPGGGRLGAEELLAHVVVDADHVQTQAGEVPDRLRPDQPSGPGYQGDSHVRPLQNAGR
jgi:hypothetical protein